MWIKDVIEITFSFGLFINAILFIPQIIRLYKAKNSEGVSLVTFAGFNLIQILVFLHGYLHDDYLLMLGYFFSIITCGSVVVLILLYRFKKKSLI